jgi:hypothetical protein
MKSNKRKMTRVVTTEMVDEQTGELKKVETLKEFVQNVDVDRFYMCFFEKMASFYGIKHLSDMKLMVALCEFAEFNSGTVFMTQRTRQRIAEKTGISLTNISKNLKRLIAIELITYNAGDYQINPEVFWKGDIKTRKELLRLDGIQFNITLVGTDF